MIHNLDDLKNKLVKRYCREQALIANDCPGIEVCLVAGCVQVHQPAAELQPIGVTCLQARCESYNQPIQVGLQVDTTQNWTGIAYSIGSMSTRIVSKTALDGSLVSCATVQAAATGSRCARSESASTNSRRKKPLLLRLMRSRSRRIISSSTTPSAA